MLVLLPPSETKRRDGDSEPLDLAGLSFPSLTRTRRRLVRALVALSRDPVLARSVLGLSARQDGEVALNAALRRGPTLPALHRYTGVLYDALDYPTLDPPARRRADESLVVASALFGPVRAADRIPAYRLSGGAALPGVGRLAAVWRPVLEPLLHGGDGGDGGGRLVVDLRSSTYQALARTPGAVTVRVVTERPDGGRVSVSHHNKATKGLLARALVSAPAPPADTDGVVRAARAAGLRAEVTGPLTVDLVT